MRLFIGLDFSMANKRMLYETISNCQGNITKVDNIHLTLVFLGEIDNSALEKIKKVMDEIVIKPFLIHSKNAVLLKDILVVEFVKEKELMALQAKLQNDLQTQGLINQARPYYPHLSLVRKYKAKLMDIPYFSQLVEGVILYCSRRINGELVYQQIYKKNL